MNKKGIYISLKVYLQNILDDINIIKKKELYIN